VPAGYRGRQAADGQWSFKPNAGPDENFLTNETCAGRPAALKGMRRNRPMGPGRAP